MKFALLCPAIALAVVAPLGAQETKPAAPTAAPAAPAAEAPAAAKPDPALMDKVSYFIGTQIGTDFKRNNIDINPDVLVQAIKDAAAGTKGKYTEAELETAMQTFQMNMMMKQQQDMAKQQAELEAAGPKNLEEGNKFLAENGKRKEVTTTASGLQYEVLKKADGPKPKATDEVNVHYHGTLVGGGVFDSSVDRGEPVSFPLNQVIPGWTEGVQLMNVGSKFKFFVPAKLAYGEQARPPKIGPNSTLIFEVELLGIGGADAAPGAAPAAPKGK